MSIRVKALQKTAPDAPFRVVTIDRRDPRSTDVVIAIKAVGICHSDIHTIRNEWGRGKYPLTVGHEIAGVVTAVGEDVTKFSVGDRVGVGCMVNSCRECEPCRVGEEQHCLGNGSVGKVGTYNEYDVDGTITQGGYAEAIVVDQDFVLHVPDSLDFAEAAPLLCAGITTYNPLTWWHVGPGMKVAVMGLGGLGHMGVQIAAALGADVTVLSRSMKKADAAAELGATRTLATTAPGFFQEHANEFDMLLNTISADIDLGAYLGLLKPRGVFAAVGLPPRPQALPFRSVIGAARSISGSIIGSIAQTQEMLDFCAEHDVKPYIEKVTIDDVDAAYDRVVAGDVRFRCVIDTASFAHAVPVEHSDAGTLAHAQRIRG